MKLIMLFLEIIALAAMVFLADLFMRGLLPLP